MPYRLLCTSIRNLLQNRTYIKVFLVAAAMVTSFVQYYWVYEKIKISKQERVSKDNTDF